MIVRGDSEAKQFERCLKSFMPYVDGLYVAVTGLESHKKIHKLVTQYNGLSVSTSPETHPEIYTTIEHPDNLDKKVTFFSNFAAARNVSFDLVPEKEYDYVTWADVDDVIVSGGELKVCASLAKARKFDVVYFTYWYETRRDENDRVQEIEIDQVRERLMRPGKFRWVSRLHEVAIQADPAFRPESSEWDLKDGRRCCWLHLSDPQEWTSKLERNKRILMVQLEEEKWEDPRTIFSLAKIYFDMGDPDSLRRCLDLIAKYLEKSGWDAERANALEYAGLVHEKNGDFKRAIAAYWHGIAEYPMDTMLWLRLTNAYYELGHTVFGDHMLSMAEKLEMPKASTLIQNPKDIKILLTALKFRQAANKGLTADMVYWAEKRAAILGKDDGALADAKQHHYTNEAARGLFNYSKWLKDAGLKDRIPTILETVPKEWGNLPFIHTIKNDLGIVTEWPKGSIVYYAHMSISSPHFETWDWKSLEKGIGGSETAVIQLTEKWAKAGRDVTVFADVEEESVSPSGVKWKPYYSINWNDKFDNLILWRQPRLLERVNNAKHIYIDLHDVCSALDYPSSVIKKIDGIFFKSKYHRAMVPHLPDKKAFIVSNGITLPEFENRSVDPAKRNKLFYGSSYDRGLEHLLRIWPKIRELNKEATLEICYGWNLFETVFKDNPERMAWKEKMDELMSCEGVTQHGRLGQDELRKVRKECGIWAYPTHFTEINCITALESQSDGLVPVVINLAALDETVGSGIKVEGDIYLKPVREEYLQKLTSLMGDEAKWKAESEKAKEFAKLYSWDLVSAQWLTKMSE